MLCRATLDFGFITFSSHGLGWRAWARDLIEAITDLAPLTPFQPRHILFPKSCQGWGLLVDRLAYFSECWRQAAHCRRRADTATDERMRALWRSLARMWTTLGANGEKVRRLDDKGAAHETTGETQVTPRGPRASMRPMPQAHRILFPGRKVDDVTYRCEECGGEVMRPVPRAR
jgi:hypothetical protein